RVRADFAPDMRWTDSHARGYAAFVAGQVSRHDLRPFHNSAVARLVEHGAREAEHQQRLSAQLLDVAEVVREANHWAGVRLAGGDANHHRAGAGRSRSKGGSDGRASATTTSAASATSTSGRREAASV